MENNLVKIDKWEDSDGYDEMYGEWFICPNCKNSTVIFRSNYCSKCGVKFEWTNSKNKENEN